MLPNRAKRSLRQARNCSRSEFFAIQTRRQELRDLEERDLARLEAREKYTESDKKLSSIVNRKNVNSRQLATIKSNGDKVLFGGHTTKQMKEKLGINSKSNTPLADFLPTISLTAKQLANEMTYVRARHKVFKAPKTREESRSSQVSNRGREFIKTALYVIIAI